MPAFGVVHNDFLITTVPPIGMTIEPRRLGIPEVSYAMQRSMSVIRIVPSVIRWLPSRVAAVELHWHGRSKMLKSKTARGANDESEQNLNCDGRIQMYLNKEYIRLVARWRWQ